MVRVVMALDSGMRAMVRRAGWWMGTWAGWLRLDVLASDAELEDLEGAVEEMEALAGGVGEVDEQVGALGGGEVEAGERDGGGEQALVGADLVEGLAGR